MPKEIQQLATLSDLSDFSHIAWYPLDERTGTAVADRFGNDTTGGVIQGATDPWRRGACFCSEGAYTGIRFAGDYVTELYDLSTLSNQSFMVSFDYLRPGTLPSFQYLFACGYIPSTTVGAYGVYPTGTTANAISLYFGIPGGTGNTAYTGNNIGDELDSDDNNKWVNQTFIFHDADGVLYMDRYLQGIYNGSGRLFQIEDARPTVSATARFTLGARYLNTTTVANGTTAGTGFRNLVLARTAGDIRHKLPRHVRELTDAMLNGGIPKWMRAA